VELIPATRRSRCVGVEATAARYNGGDDGDARLLPLPVALIAGNLFSSLYHVYSHEVSPLAVCSFISLKSLKPEEPFSVQWK
ncbi:unnamed protein product, partial [Urochloa humidicola]